MSTAPAPRTTTDREPTRQYVAAMERLVEVVQNLSQARDLPAIMEIVRKEARALTGADGATFVLRDGDKCHYAEEDAVSPLWRGQRFPMTTCISGWSMMNGASAMIEDIYADPRIPADAYRPTFVKSLAMVPIRAENPIGAIGNYWAGTHMPTEEEMSLLRALANVTSVAMENVGLTERLEEKVRALEESNGDLARFAWVASHDLKSPLRAVDNLSRWVEEELGDSLPGRTGEYMELLRLRVRRMEKLLDDLLDYAQIGRKLEAAPAEIVGADRVVDDIRLLVDIPSSFRLSVTGDFAALRVPRLPLDRVLCNLVDNAVKHHDRGGGEITVSCAARDGRYLFSVADDGPGIPPEYREQAMEPFQTLQPRDRREGSGMGLAMVRRILECCGGDMEIAGSVPRGTTVRFTLPAGIGQPAEATP